MAIPDDPFAFPLSMTPDSIDFPGMTLRDWFAGQTLPHLFKQCIDDSPACYQNGEGYHQYCARKAYEAADAMLAERAKPQLAAEPAMRHVAYYDEGQFHWMSGIAPRDCELYAKAPGA